MKERPILFSAPMVRAILAGTKTQTRRVAPVRALNIRRHDGDMLTWSVSFLKSVKGVLGSHSGGAFSDIQARSIIASQFNPYGQPGDRLWVREAFCDDWRETRGTQYRADGELDSEMFDAGCKWQPSIHMPRAASRILLEVTAVRVERLQDISIEDAKAEGAWPDSSVVDRCMAYFGIDALAVNPRLAFRMVWEQINGPGSWDANPWVWVVEFKRVTP